MLKVLVRCLESLVHFTSGNHFIYNVPEVSTKIVTLLRVVVCLAHSGSFESWSRKVIIHEAYCCCAKLKNICICGMFFALYKELSN
jgi:hypothetical protein